MFMEEYNVDKSIFFYSGMYLHFNYLVFTFVQRIQYFPDPQSDGASIAG